jgi:hypothetical protein
MLTKTYNTWKFEELTEEQQEKVLDNYRYINVEDSYWYDYDGKTGFTTKELQRMKVNPKDAPDDLISYKNLYFDLCREWWIQFTDAEFTNNEVARKFLRVPKKIWENTYWSFYGTRYHNTELQWEYGNGFLTDRVEEILNRAVEIFSDKIEKALKDLRDSYEWLMTDEAVKETILCNDYDFDEHGKIS